MSRKIPSESSLCKSPAFNQRHGGTIVLLRKKEKKKKEDKEVKDKIVRIPVPEDITCPVLDLRIETFKNVGETCNERAKQGLTCEGPFESSPSVVRKYSVAADRVHFVLSEGVSSGSGRVIRACFEDQDAETIRSVKNDPARAEALGIDFNDAIFELSSPALPFEISGAAGTRCKSTQ